ncbi:MAG: hypothetical protein R6U70_04280 [Bacillota bacterium]
MDSEPRDTDLTVNIDEYVLSLERRIRLQQEQISRLRRRGRVLMNLLLDLGAGRQQVRGEGKVLSLFGEDSTTEPS